MRKFLKIIIIILVVLLLAQMIYFNIIDEDETNDNNEIINTNQISDTNTLNTTNETNSISEETSNTITPRSWNYLLERYTGNARLSQLEEDFYKLVNTDFNEIYKMTTMKSQNRILQLYDLNTSTINSMNIYSAEDFANITSQIFLVGTATEFDYSYIITDSYNENDNGYTSFIVCFTYKNNTVLQIKVYVANSIGTTPNVRFGGIQ